MGISARIVPIFSIGLGFTMSIVVLKPPLNSNERVKDPQSQRTYRFIGFRTWLRTTYRKMMGWIRNDKIITRFHEVERRKNISFLGFSLNIL